MKPTSNHLATSSAWREIRIEERAVPVRGANSFKVVPRDDVIGELPDRLHITARGTHVALLCGRYEGVDERIREHLATDAVWVGPYVLSGGELAAMVVADAVIRKLPGALGHAESAVEESFSEALGGAPEYPHYTRPSSYRGWEVPEVLISGDHARVREWRLEQTRKRAAAASER